MELEQLSQSVRNSYCVAAAADEGQLERVSAETRRLRRRRRSLV